MGSNVGKLEGPVLREVNQTETDRRRVLAWVRGIINEFIEAGSVVVTRAWRLGGGGRTRGPSDKISKLHSACTEQHCTVYLKGAKGAALKFSHHSKQMAIR